MADMDSFECVRPSGEAECSAWVLELGSFDKSSCGEPGGLYGLKTPTKIPRGGGFLYISAELVKRRRAARRLVDVEIIVLAIKNGEQWGQKFKDAMTNEFMPILLCEVCAKKRGIDLTASAADAKRWWDTGTAPLRATPSTRGCFIATACYGSPDCREVETLRRFRDERMRLSVFGRLLVAAYYWLSPPIARLLNRHLPLRICVRERLVEPIVEWIEAE